jgi:hypothetical protein
MVMYSVIQLDNYLDNQSHWITFNVMLNHVLLIAACMPDACDSKTGNICQWNCNSYEQEISQIGIITSFGNSKKSHALI